MKGAFVESNSAVSNYVYRDQEDPEFIDMSDAEKASAKVKEFEAFANGKYDYTMYMPEEYAKDSELDYAATTSPREAMNLTAKLNQRKKYLQDMAEYPAASFVAGMVGSVTDLYQLPLMFLMPQGALLTKVAKARLGLLAAEEAESVLANTALTAMHGAKVGAVAGALAEVTNSTPGRSADERVYSVLASSLFNSALSAGGYNFKALRNAAQEVDLDMRTIDTHPLLSELGPIPKFDGKAPAEVVELAIKKVDEEIAAGNIDPAGRQSAIDTLVEDTVRASSELKYPKFYKTAAFMMPVVRLMASPIHESRALTAALLHSPLQRRSMKVDPPVEVIMRQQSLIFKSDVARTVQGRYRDYIKTAPKGQRMNIAEFKAQVSEAMANGGVHEDLNVQSAAKDILKHTDAFNDRALKCGVVKRGYMGFEKLTFEDLRQAGVDAQQIRKLTRYAEDLSDSEYQQKMDEFESQYPEPDLDSFLTKLEDQYFPKPEMSMEEQLHEVGSTQRGAPEIAMTEAQKAMGGSGLLSYALEHGGDLTDTMTRGVKQNAGYYDVLKKVRTILKSLKDEYGFERELDTQLAKAQQRSGLTEGKFHRVLNSKLRKYVEEHKKVPVYNEAQRVARQVAIDLGNKDFNSAIKNLETLQSHLGSKEEWVKYAHEGLGGIGRTKYKKYSEGLMKLANRTLLKTSAKTREFRARVKELASSLAENEGDTLGFEQGLQIEELMAEYGIKDYRRKLRRLEKKYFPDPETAQDSFNKALDDHINKIEARREAAVLAESKRLREKVPELDQDAVGKLPDEILERLHAAGKLDIYNAEPAGDLGRQYRLYDPKKVGADPQGFKDHVVQILEEEFRAAKGNKTLEAEIKESEAAIAALKKQVEKGEGKSEARESASQEQLDLEAELEHERSQGAPEEVLAEIQEEIDAIKKTGSTVEKQLREEEARLEQLMARKNEEWEDIQKQIPGYVQDMYNKVMHQGNPKAMNTMGLESLTLGDRTISVSYDKIKRWLNEDVERSLERWIDDLLPKITMAERFGGPDGFKLEFERVLQAFDREIENLNGDLKAQQKMAKAKSDFSRDMKAMVDTIHNRYGLSQNPDGILHKGSQYLRWMNMITKLGMMTFSAIPDLGSVIARQGMNTLQFGRFMWTPEGKAMRSYLNDIGVMADVYLGQAHERYSLADSKFTNVGRVDALARDGVKLFNKVTGMNHWNAHLKRFVAGVQGMGMIRDAHLLKAGKLSAKKLKYYETLYMSKEHLLRLADVAKPGKPIDVTNWPPDLRDRFSAALFSEADTVIVTPTVGEMPLMASSDLGKIVLQFKSFAISSHHKLMLSTIDDVTAQKLIGLASMVFFGHVSQMAKSVIKGEPLPKNEQQKIKNAINAAGIFALGMEANAIVERMTSGQLSAYYAMGLDGGEAITYNNNQSPMDYLMGPTAGTLNNIKHIATMAVTGDPKASDWRAARRSIPLNNLWMLYRSFNALEQAAIERTVK